VPTKCKGSNMKFMSPLQEQAHNVLTHFSFQKFQEEFERSAQYSIDHESDNVFVLRFYKDINSRKHVVFWDGKITTCSCKHFEFWGVYYVVTFLVFFFIKIVMKSFLTTYHHSDCFKHHLMIKKRSPKLMLSLRSK
jgi:hypothetical protein